mmetsp:Transcript_42959/g.98659  ORF Transcript_42959/g.98659 Transcript_42959/m.98659 type:complete len:213 (-) Transcript_42959:45-683(-)|eukprot:5654377-Amphidinium_carterae.2
MRSQDAPKMLLTIAMVFLTVQKTQTFGQLCDDAELVDTTLNIEGAEALSQLSPFFTWVTVSTEDTPENSVSALALLDSGWLSNDGVVSDAVVRRLNLKAQRSGRMMPSVDIYLQLVQKHEYTSLRMDASVYNTTMFPQVWDLVKLAPDGLFVVLGPHTWGHVGIILKPESLSRPAHLQYCKVIAQATMAAFSSTSLAEAAVQNTCKMCPVAG